MIYIFMLFHFACIKNVLSFGYFYLNRSSLEKIVYNQGINHGEPFDLYSTTSIDLSNQGIHYIDADTFKDLKHIKVLILFDNHIETREFEDKIFAHLENLEELYIDNAFNWYTYDYDYRVILKSFSQLTKLKVLSMGRLPVLLDNPYFENLTLLESLSFYASLHPEYLFDYSLFINSKYKIVSNAFKGLKNLKELNLAANQLMKNEIQFECFEELQNLEILDFGDNSLGTLTTNDQGAIVGLPDPNVFFKGLSNLKSLNLMYNKIVYLENGYFERLTKLEYLSLIYNAIDIYDNQNLTKVNKETFRGLKKLKTLLLAHNSLADVSDSCFEYLENLVMLNVFSTSIPFRKETFKGLSNLKSLEGGERRNTYMDMGCWCEDIFEYLVNLDYLSITGWNFGFKNDSNVFNGLGNLSTLVLSNNKISHLHDGLFEKLKGLENLDLSENKLGTINSKTFSGLSDLRDLDLSRNTINMLHDGSFEMLKKLEILDLSRNMLSTINRSQFKGLYRVNGLSLNKNMISAIDVHLVQGLPSLRYIDLSGNKITKPYALNLQGLDCFIV